MSASLSAARHSAQLPPQRLHRTTRAPASWTAQRSAPCRRRTAARAVKAVEVQRSLDLLQIVQVRGLVELKRAYYERIRELHPDVNQDRDTTDEAAAVNAAYDTLCEVRPRRNVCNVREPGSNNYTESVVLYSTCTSDGASDVSPDR